MKQNKQHTIFETTKCISEGILLNYVNNKLSNKDRNVVERHTINCNFCSDAIEGFETSGKGSDGYFDLRDNFNKNKSKTILYYATAIAASIALVLLINNNSQVLQESVANAKIATDSSEINDFKNTKHKSPKKDIQKQDVIIINSKDQYSNATSEPEEIIEEAEFTSIVEDPDLKTNSFFKDSLSEIRTTYNWNESQSENQVNNLNGVAGYLADTSDKITISMGSYSVDEASQKERKKNNSPIENENIAKTIAEKKEESVIVAQEKIVANKLKTDNDLKSKDSSKQYFALGKILFKEQKWKLAIKELVNVDQSNLDHYFEANYLIGIAYIKLGDKTAAKQYFEISSNPDSSWKEKSQAELNK